MSGTEPRMAMVCRNAEDQECWFYPADPVEAREYLNERGAVPHYPWPESGAPAPVFPWTMAEVRGA
jgi:hypothetical protein